MALPSVTDTAYSITIENLVFEVVKKAAQRTQPTTLVNHIADIKSSNVARPLRVFPSEQLVVVDKYLNNSVHTENIVISLVKYFTSYCLSKGLDGKKLVVVFAGCSFDIDQEKCTVDVHFELLMNLLPINEPDSSIELYVDF